MLIGEAYALRKMAEVALFLRKSRELPQHIEDDDQALLTLAFLRNNSLLSLDYHSRLFLSMYKHNEDEFEWHERRISPKKLDGVTRASPLFFHFNGEKGLYEKFAETIFHRFSRRFLISSISPFSLSRENIQVGVWLNEGRDFAYSHIPFSQVCPDFSL
jgi:hypothetical protein